MSSDKEKVVTKVSSTPNFDAALEMISPSVVAEFYREDEKLAQRCDKHDIPIEELSCSRSAPCVVCGEVVGGIGNPRGHTRWAKDDAKYVLRSSSGWILTLECPPPDGKTVLAWFKGEEEIVFASFRRHQYLQDSYWWCNSAEWRADTFSHWRPLPEPP